MEKGYKSLLHLLDENLSKDNVVYLTDDLFITDNISHIPHLAQELLHIDMSIYVICKDGHMCVTIDNKEHHVCSSSILICTGLQVVSNAMVSTDFKCSIVGLSHRKLIELFPNDKEILTDFMLIKENPIMQLSEEDVHLLNLYKGIFDAKCRGDKLKLDNIILDKLLYAVIYELIQLYARNVSPHSNTLTYMKGHLYGQEFLSLLAEDKCHHRKVGYYADKLCITPRYLSIVCQKETGKTPSEWIREKTVGHISHYLLNTTLSVKEICSVLDFPNSSFLCKFTKKHLGMSPMTFRQKNENSNA